MNIEKNKAFRKKIFCKKKLKNYYNYKNFIALKNCF